MPVAKRTNKKDSLTKYVLPKTVSRGLGIVEAYYKVVFLLLLLQLLLL